MGRTREPSGFSAENEVGKDTDGVCPRVGIPSARALKDAAAVLPRNCRRDDLGWSEAVWMRMAEKLYLANHGAVKQVLADRRSRCHPGLGKCSLIATPAMRLKSSPISRTKALLPPKFHILYVGLYG
jgi:hypothetical protein